ncbi:MAG: hypothetical protein JRH20_29565, partial [Deltaproteobacteria bacterium]|nr:hypothetical protein [Deltaproteobacteria bacterium]
MRNRNLLIYGTALLILGCAGNDDNSNKLDADGAPPQSDGLSCPEARDCRGRACGPDPVCSVSCGSCSAGTCNALGTCRAEPTCDPACVAGERCKNGFCVKPEGCS